MTTASDSLLSPEILSRICSFCYTTELKQLAIANKALSAPAVQKIWHRLPSFVPLVYTLPPDAWESSNGRVNNVRYRCITERSFTLTRPLVAADFARLRVYAPLVKIIAEPLYISMKDVLSPSVWTSFREHGIGSLFDLSSLHYVSLAPSSRKQRLADPIHDFIGPSLLKFNLILQGGKAYDDLIRDPGGRLEARPDPVLLDLLAQLSSQCPRLRHFELDTTPFPFYASDALSDAVCRWSHLRSFEAYTCPLGPAAWKHLASLPSLWVLSTFLDLPTDVLADALLPNPQGPVVFPALHELTLHARRLETCTVVLETIKSTTLTKVSLYAYAHAGPDDIQRVCAALAACASHDAITELLVKPGCTTHRPPRPPSSESAPTATERRAAPRQHAPLPHSALAPLLSLGSLEKVYLLGPCFSSLSDATLAAVAHACPHLCSAVLCPDADADAGVADARVTLAGLSALAQLADLRSARLPLADVDARAVADAFAHWQSQRKQAAHPSSAARRPGPPPARASAPAPALGPTGVAAPALTPTSTPPPDPSPELGLSKGGLELEGSAATSPLCVLAVGRARIAEECVEGTAAALSAWFPHLSGTNFAVDVGSTRPALRAMGFRDREEAAEVMRRWERVGELVGDFAVVREQERRWAAGHRAAPT